MLKRIIMPKQGLQMTEGTILQWLVEEGGPVESGAPLFEMETDKLTITIESPESGTLLKIVRQAGETVPITELIAVVGDAGEDVSEILADSASPQTEVAEGGKKPSQLPSPAPASIPQKQDGRPLASPRAREKAKELGVDWTTLTGSTPQGWIAERDVLAAAQRPAATPLARKVAAQTGVALSGITGSGPKGKIRRRDVESATAQKQRTIIPMTGMRRVVAQRMKASLETNAQATHRISVRMTEASRLRGIYQEAGRKISYNDIVALCVVRALSEHPQVNVELTPEGLWHKEFVHLGIAVALDDGLVVPVVHNAHQMCVEELSQSIRALAAGAREGTLSPDGYTGGSFTISNLGMYGLEEFTAIINPPESGILAVGAVEPTPVAVDDRVEIHPVMKLTLSYDHRVIDGAPAAMFLGTIKRYLENPYFLL